MEETSFHIAATFTYLTEVVHDILQLNFGDGKVKIHVKKKSTLKMVKLLMR